MKIRLMSGYDRLNNIVNIMKNYKSISEQKPITLKTINPENIKPDTSNKNAIKK